MLAVVLAQVALTMLTGRSEGSGPDLVPHNRAGRSSAQGTTTEPARGSLKCHQGRACTSDSTSPLCAGL